MNQPAKGHWSASIEFRVAVRVLEYNLSGEPIWFTKLIDDMNSNHHDISIALDKLNDCGILYSLWKKIDGYWEHTLHIEESMIPFVTGIKNMLDSIKTENKGE